MCCVRAITHSLSLLHCNSITNCQSFMLDVYYCIICKGAQSDDEIATRNGSCETFTSDRGYTSDGELYESQSKAYRCPSPLEVRPVPENGSWVLVSIFLKFYFKSCRCSDVCWMK